MNERRTKQRLDIPEGDCTIEVTKRMRTWGPGDQINCVQEGMEIEVAERDFEIERVSQGEQTERVTPSEEVSAGVTKSKPSEGTVQQAVKGGSGEEAKMADNDDQIEMVMVGPVEEEHLEAGNTAPWNVHKGGKLTLL